MIPGQKIGFAEPWHGEWMAEIVHQIAPEAKIIPIRARPNRKENERSASNEQPYEKYLLKGIRFAADQGAAAVTNSMGPVKHCEELSEVVDYAEKRGTVFINVHPEYLVYTKQTFKKCKAGHCNKKIIHPGLVSVPNYPTEPATNRDIYVWPYQTDPKFRDGWGYSNGPPIVGGVVALMRSVNPKLTPEEIKNIIIATAYFKDGFKILDAEACVLEAIKRNK